LDDFYLNHQGIPQDSAARQFRENRHKKRLINFVIYSFTHNAQLSCEQRCHHAQTLHLKHQTN
ncbi:hypothetical protein K6U52_05610, partial [Vibrio vulnificus]|uniref:hypothetical protein n=1 Tax=Vibrio vulnificus TaxID=672 RepID=UPI001EEC50F0